MSNVAANINPVAIGRILKVSRNPANVLIQIPEPVPYGLKRSATLQKGHWEIQIVGNTTSYTRAMKALQRIYNNPETSTQLLSLLIHPKAPLMQHCAASVSTSSPHSFLPVPQTDSAESAFNSSQEQAIAASLSQRVTLIQGPPGTGKTHVACEIVCRFLAMKPNEKVLVVAETNNAADTFTVRLLNAGVRVSINES